MRPRSTKVADGRVFTGRQAIELKLIDEIGNEQTALAWLAQGEENSTPTRRCATGGLRPRIGDLPFLHVAAVATLDAVGFEQCGALAREAGTRS